MQPVREVQEAVVHRDNDVGDQPGHSSRKRPALELLVLDLDHRFGDETAVRAVEAKDVARQCRADEALLRVGIVEPADLEREQPLLAEIQRLHQASFREIPEMEPAPVAAGGHVVDVEARLVGVRLAELRRGQHVLSWLIPEVVAEVGRRAALLPAPLHLEGPRVEDREAAGAAPVPIPEHAHDDVVARHAMDRVGPRVTRPLEELLGLDHPLDVRAPRVVGDADDVDPR